MRDKLYEKIINDIINIKNLNQYYINNVCDIESRKIINTYNIVNKGRIDTVCYITTAALVWVLSGKDLATPFLGKWEISNKNYKNYKHCAIAFSILTDNHEDDFEDGLEHTIVSLNYGEIILDSHWGDNRTLTIIKNDGECLQNFVNPKGINGSYRYTEFDISDDIEERLKLLK